MAFVTLLATGLLTLALPAAATNFNVGNQDQLANAIKNAQNGDTITFTADITLSANLGQVQRNVTIDGNNHTLSGSNRYRGLYVASGNVSIIDLTIANTLAQGGKGGNAYSVDNIFLYGSGGAGGGGAGLGGALFVAKGANVTVSNVKLLNDQARGGSGGTGVPPGSGNGRTSGGGGGLFGDGGNGGITRDGNAGAGGGGAGGGGNGGFGGGGGGAMDTQAGEGGFGGGGGGAGMDYYNKKGTPGAGGFGGSSGGVTAGKGYGGGAGGSGAGMGGAIFVQEGGTLNLAGSLTVSGSAVAGGAGTGGRPSGAAYGSGIFLQGNGSFSLDPGAGQTQVIGDAIADQTGVAGSGGSWSLVKNGAGTTVLTGANHYSGGTTINAGILQGDTNGLQGNILDNAMVAFDQGGTGVYAGGISGTGSLTKLGTGTVTLTGTNTYAGSTTVNGGTLLLASNASLGAGGVALHNATIGIAPSASGYSQTTIDRPLTITGSGGLSNQCCDSLTWSGVISGTGTLVKYGYGTATISGINTYTGGTAVNDNGVLLFTSDANLGRFAGITLSSGGEIGTAKDATAAMAISRPIELAATGGGIYVTLNPLTWSGDISGPGSFTKDGPGELELTGTNTYAGGTVIKQGTLRVASDAELGPPGTIMTFYGNGSLRASTSFASSRAIFIGNGGASFQVDDGVTLTLSGNLVSNASTPSGITKVGAGTLILGGNNTYTGNSYVNGGTLQGNTGSIRGNILLDSNADNPVARSVTFDQVSDGTYAGVISGLGSLTKIGAGKLSLPGVQTFTGATNIDAGNLNVNGSLESSSVVNVNPGATLSGNGKFGNVKNNGGTISPGNSIGTVHIDGDLTMAPDSTYYVQINGDTSDLIQVSGTANIQSSTIQIAHDSNSAAAPVVPGKTYTMLTTGNGLTTTPFLLGVADFPFISFQAIAGDYNGYLTTTRGPDPFSSLASTANEKAVANALDSLPATNLLWQQVVGATTAQAQAAFTSLGSASFHANVTAALSAQSLFLRGAVLDRLRQGAKAEDAGADRSTDMAATGQTVATHDGSPAVAVWVHLLGSQGTLRGNANAASIDDTLGGGLIGVDATVNQWRLGVAGGYTHSTFDSSTLSAQGSSRSYHLAFYGGTQRGAWGLRGGASLSWNDIATSRTAGAVNVGGVQRGDYLDKTQQAFIEAGRRSTFAHGSLEPFANLAYVHVQGNVNETGAAAVDGSSRLATTYTTLGLHGTAAPTPRLTIRGTLGWQHAMGDVTPVATLAFAPGGMPFDLAGAPIARNALVAEASFNYAVSAHASLGLAWTGQIANHNHDNAVQGLFNWQF